MRKKHLSKRITLKKVIKFVFFLVCIGAIWSYFVFIPTDIAGTSMLPTLEGGDKILVNTRSEIDRFDIVVFRDPGMKPVVKRVIGLPGETLYFHNDKLFIDGVHIPEYFLSSTHESEKIGLKTSNFTFSEITGISVIPKDEYFVMGDNRRYSYDSRHYGTIPQSSVIGEAQLLYFPFDHATFLNPRNPK